MLKNPAFVFEPSKTDIVPTQPQDVSGRRTFETLACYVIALYKSTFTYLLTVG